MIDERVIDRGRAGRLPLVVDRLVEFRMDLACYRVLPVALGLQFILLPAERWAAPLYAPFKRLASIHDLGIVWLVFAATFILAMHFSRPNHLPYALLYGATFYLFFAALFTFAAVNTNGTFIGALLFLAMSWFMFASSRQASAQQWTADPAHPGASEEAVLRAVAIAVAQRLEAGRSDD